MATRSTAMLFFIVSIAGCANAPRPPASETLQDDDPFAEIEDDTRETVLINPAEGVDTRFDIRRASLDTAHIRVDGWSASGAVVEVLVKGAFPDGCSELHELDQAPMHSGQRAVLTMRRPSQAICTQVVRPYRFFFTLDRRFAPGRYTLMINERPFMFDVIDRNPR